MSERAANGTAARSSTCGLSLFRIKPGDSPFFGLARIIFILAPTQRVNHAIDKGVTTDFGTDVDLTEYVSVVIELQNPPFIPLTHVQMFSIEAQVGTGEIGA